MVCGYRIDRKDTPLRCLYSRVYNWIVRLLLGITVRDVDCALKLFRRDVVQDLQIRSNGFLVNSELLTQARQQGHSIVEVGVSHRPRAGGESSVSIRHIPGVLANLMRYWWNVVQFPGVAPRQDHAIMQQDAEDRQRGGGWSWGPLLWLLIAALFLLTNLNYPLIDRDETRYAEIPREMLATGNWILPTLNFEPYYDKPPLLYWGCALSYSLFGVHEWTARLVPALAGWFTLAATMWFGSRWFGRRVGFLSGVALSLTAGFLFCSRYLLTDGLFTALATLSWMTAFEAIRGPRLGRWWWLASAVFVGLAFLVKGPLALVLWMPPLVAFAWLSETSARPRRRDFAAWLVVAVSVVGPWIVCVAVQDPRYLSEFLLKHNFQRFAGAFHTKPIWYFLPVILIAGHPWSSMTFPLARFLFSHRREHAAQRSQALGFTMLWCLWCVAFFSLSKCKLATYVLPIAPACALIVGVYLRRVLSAPADWADRLAGVWSPRLATLISCSIAVGLLIFEFVTASGTISLLMFWTVVWTVLIALLVRSVRKDPSPMLAWSNSLLATALFGVMVMHQLLPAYSRSQSLLGDDANLRDQVAGADQVVTIAHEFSEVPFYLNLSNVTHRNEFELGNLEESLASCPQTVLVVHDRVAIDRIRERLPAQASLQLIKKRGDASFVEVRLSSGANHKGIALAPRPNPY